MCLVPRLSRRGTFTRGRCLLQKDTSPKPPPETWGRSDFAPTPPNGTMGRGCGPSPLDSPPRGTGPLRAKPAAADIDAKQIDKHHRNRDSYSRGPATRASALPAPNDRDWSLLSAVSFPVRVPKLDQKWSSLDQGAFLFTGRHGFLLARPKENGGAFLHRSGAISRFLAARPPHPPG